MTKQEKIKESYGEHWYLVEKYADENGWIKSLEFSYYQNINGMSEIPIINIFGGKDRQFINCKSNYLGDGENEIYWRPKSLQGIENNNGWNSMDQPDFEENEYVLFLRFVDGEGEPPIFTCVLCDDFEIGYFTHWKRVDYKKPPIY